MLDLVVFIIIFDDVDVVVVGVVIDLLCEVDVLFENFGVILVVELCSGGLGVCEFKWLVKVMGIDELWLGLIFEIVVVVGLIVSGMFDFELFYSDGFFWVLMVVVD